MTGKTLRKKAQWVGFVFKAHHFEDEPHESNQKSGDLSNSMAMSINPEERW
jgi:hypothetical protein